MLSYNDLIGRTLLAHLTIYKNGRLADEKALFGEIEYADKGGVVFRTDSGEHTCLPGNLESYVPAARGAYEFLENGSIRTVSDPDFFTAWDINRPCGNTEDTEKCRPLT